MNQVGATLFETLLFLYVKRTVNAEHTLFLCTSGKNRETAGELQGLRENVMSPNGFPWYHFDSSILLHCLSLSHSAINVL